MSFWLDRFRKEDEEDIWEELKQMLLNSDALEAEKKLQEAREMEVFNQAWDRIHGVNDKTSLQKEPSLRYEDLLNPQGLQKRMQEQYMQEDYQRLMQNSRGDLTPQDILQKMDMFSPKKMNGINSLAENYEPEELVNELTPLQKGYISTERQLTPYEEIDSRQDWSEEMKAQKKAEVAKIQEAARAREKEIDREHAIKQAKNYGGAALEVGSLAIPGMLQRKVATQAIKMGKPLAEQIVKKTVKRGAVEGTLSGAVEGLGRGIREDENPLKTIAQGAMIGGVAGTALGKVAGEAVTKTPKIKELDDVLDKRKDWGIPFRKQAGKPKEAIEKLLEQKEGFVPKATSKEGVGDIDFVWGKQDYETGQGYGFEHIIDGRTRKNKIDGEEFIRTLPETFENGTITKDARYPDNVYIEDLDNKIALPNNFLGKPRNWVLTAHPQNKSARKRLAASAPMSKPNVDSRYSNFTTELTADNNIIPPVQQNLNPNSQTIRNKLSHNAWLEELKRKRKRRGMF